MALFCISTRWWNPVAQSKLRIYTAFTDCNRAVPTSPKNWVLHAGCSSCCMSSKDKGIAIGLLHHVLIPPLMCKAATVYRYTFGHKIVSQNEIALPIFTGTGPLVRATCEIGKYTFFLFHRMGPLSFRTDTVVKTAPSHSTIGYMLFIPLLHLCGMNCFKIQAFSHPEWEGQGCSTKSPRVCAVAPWRHNFAWPVHSAPFQYTLGESKEMAETTFVTDFSLRFWIITIAKIKIHTKTTSKKNFLVHGKLCLLEPIFSHGFSRSPQHGTSEAWRDICCTCSCISAAPNHGFQSSTIQHHQEAFQPTWN